MIPIPLEEQQKKESVNTLEEIQTHYTDKFDDLEEPTKKECSCNKKEELPELEEVHSGDDEYEKWKERQEDELIHKRMNDINTFQAHENEVYLRGTDEYGKDFQICFDAYNFLDWIDTEHLEYIKEQLIKHIQTK